MDSGCRCGHCTEAEHPCLPVLDACLVESFLGHVENVNRRHSDPFPCVAGPPQDCEIERLLAVIATLEPEPPLGAAPHYSARPYQAATAAPLWKRKRHSEPAMQITHTRARGHTYEHSPLHSPPSPASHTGALHHGHLPTPPFTHLASPQAFRWPNARAVSWKGGLVDDAPCWEDESEAQRAAATLQMLAAATPAETDAILSHLGHILTGSKTHSSPETVPRASLRRVKSDANSPSPPELHTSKNKDQKRPAHTGSAPEGSDTHDSDSTHAPSAPRKRHRRRKHQLLLGHVCPVGDCGRRYEAWRSLQAHALKDHKVKLSNKQHRAKCYQPITVSLPCLAPNHKPFLPRDK